MENTIRMLTKQLQLLEIEIGNYMLAKKYKEPIQYAEEYYAGLAHACKGLKYTIQALNRGKEGLYVH